MKTRLERLRDKFAALELDAFFVSSPENRRYLSGFAGSAGYLLISRDAAVLAHGLSLHGAGGAAGAGLPRRPHQRRPGLAAGALQGAGR